jgi:hypothetical protein
MKKIRLIFLLLLVIFLLVTCFFQDLTVTDESSDIPKVNNDYSLPSDKTNYYIKSAYSNYYLTVENNSNEDGAKIIVSSNNAGMSQIWLSGNYGGIFALINLNSMRLLDVDSNQPMLSGASIVQWTFKQNPPNQFWQFIPVGYNTYNIVNCVSGYYLTVDNDSDGCFVKQRVKILSGDLNPQYWILSIYQ